MIRSKTWFGLGIIVSLAILLSSRWAWAQDNWTGDSSDWDSDNWSPVGVPGDWHDGVPGPGAITNIVDSDGVSRTVTYDYTGTGALSSLTVDLTGGSGTASNTLSMSANHLTVSSEFATSGAGDEIVGYNGTGHFIQSGGTNTINRGIIYVGFFGGSSGTYNLSGTGNLEANFSSEWVGYKGTGSFTQTGGTNTVDFGSIKVGVLGGFGNYTQSGGTTTVQNGSVSLGGPAGVGSYTLSGGTLSAPTIYVGGDENGSGGSGILNVSGTGSATVTGTLQVFNNAGNALNLSGGTINTGSLNLTGNTLLLNWTGGTLNLTNSSVELDTSANNWNGFNSLTLNTGMALQVSGPESIGGSGTGSLTLAGGRNSVSLAGLTVGSSPNSSGTITISGNGSLASNGSEIIGYNGTGILNQSGGTNSPLSSDLSLGVNSGSSGTYMLSGGTLLSAPNIYIGGSSAGPGGTGVLTVSGTGSIAFGGQITVYNTPGSGFTVNGGTVNAAALNLMGTSTRTPPAMQPMATSPGAAK